MYVRIYLIKYYKFIEMIGNGISKGQFQFNYCLTTYSKQLDD